MTNKDLLKAARFALERARMHVLSGDVDRAIGAITVAKMNVDQAAFEELPKTEETR